MLHAKNLFYIHILYTQKAVHIIFENKTNFEREAFRFRMTYLYKNICQKIIIFLIGPLTPKIKRSKPYISDRGHMQAIFRKN